MRSPESQSGEPAPFSMKEIIEEARQEFEAGSVDY
jgi:hypothetical protein